MIYADLNSFYINIYGSLRNCGVTFSCHSEALNLFFSASLQRRLDLYWLLFKPHFTTKLVPAVAMGVLEKGLSWLELFKILYVQEVE